MTVQRLAAQLKARQMGALPSGEHLVRLQQVRIVKRKKGGWALQLISKTPAGATAREMRNLGPGENYYELTPGQRRSFGDFCERLGVAPDPVARAVDEIMRMTGAELTATIRQTPYSTVARHRRAGESVMKTSAGELTRQGELR